MNIEETAKLLSLMQPFNRFLEIGESTVLVWHELLETLDYTDAADALKEHLRTSEKSPMPVHLIVGARRFATNRRDKWRKTPHDGEWAEAPGGTKYCTLCQVQQDLHNDGGIQLYAAEIGSTYPPHTHEYAESGYCVHCATRKIAKNDEWMYR